jgi:hypothetical protein
MRGFTGVFTKNGGKTTRNLDIFPYKMAVLFRYLKIISICNSKNKEESNAKKIGIGIAYDNAYSGWGICTDQI